jgi:hypothetical protein
MRLTEHHVELDLKTVIDLVFVAQVSAKNRLLALCYRCTGSSIYFTGFIAVEVVPFRMTMMLNGVGAEVLVIESGLPTQIFELRK